MPVRAVLDASVFVRALDPAAASAREWLRASADGRVRALVPDLIFLEIANSLTKYVRATTMSSAEADAELRRMVETPVLRISTALLARQALALSVVRRISAYDASYLALALGSDAILVTADRRLAAEAERSALLPEQGPPG